MPPSCIFVSLVHNPHEKTLNSLINITFGTIKNKNPKQILFFFIFWYEKHVFLKKYFHGPKERCYDVLNLDAVDIEIKGFLL